MPGSPPVPAAPRPAPPPGPVTAQGPWVATPPTQGAPHAGAPHAGGYVSPSPGYAPTGYGPPAPYGHPYGPYADGGLPPGGLAPDVAGEPSSGTGLLIGGTLTLGSFYLASVLTGAGLGEACAAGAPEELEGTGVELSLCGDADVAMAYVPVVGPFIAMSELADAEISVWPLDVALVGVGIGQLTGLGLLLAGAIVGAGSDDGPATITVAPAVGPTAAALTLRSRF